MTDSTQLLDYLKRVTADLAITRERLAEAQSRPTSPSTPERQDDPIVIVGMACRYPGGVRTPSELWNLVRNEVDAVCPFPSDRGWDLSALQGGVDHGGFLQGAADFDPEFFGISPREALVMDPQQRLLLETTWEALEEAGIRPESLHGEQVGVFVGSGFQDYEHVLGNAPEVAEAYMTTATSAAVLSGRVSYHFGFEGPSLTIDTACSSSLVSLHLAAEALRAGEAGLAIAGGVMVMATPAPFVAFTKQSGLALDGRCKSYGDGADGTGWGEGVGLIVLERLSDARRHGHHVHAVIAGSAINSDGASNGLTAPNGLSQQRVIAAALDNAGITTADVQVVEGHGTGTRLGDPIEAQALLATYGKNRAGDAIYLGSIKSNMGHTQAAAGVASVIKMVEAIRHGLMPKSLHSEQPSTQVNWGAGRVTLLDRSRPWPEVPVRRAAVSSFGISGTNAHVILAQAPEAESTQDSASAGIDGRMPLLLSARTADGVRSLAAELAATVDKVAPPSAARALAARTPHPERAVVWGSTPDEIAAALASLASHEHTDPQSESALPPGTAVGRAADNAGCSIVLGGSGPWWVAAGRSLLTVPAFTRALTEVLRAAIGAPVPEPVGAASLVAASAPASGADSGTSAKAAVRVVRDALAGTSGIPEDDRLGVLAVGVGLVKTLQAWGIEPTALSGFGTGAIAAGVAAGSLTVEEGIALLHGVAPETTRRATVPLAFDGSPSQVWDRLAAASAAPGRAIADIAGPAAELPGAVAAFGCADRLVGARPGDDLPTLLGELWVQGIDLDWNAIVGQADWPSESLPGYPFAHQRYWLDMPATGDAESLGLAGVRHPVLGAQTLLAGTDQAVLTGRLSLSSHPWLADHKVGPTVVFPGAGLVELALSAAHHVGAAAVHELTLSTPLVLPPQGAVQVQVVVSGGADGDVLIFSRGEDDADWTQHAEGRLSAEPADDARPAPRPATAIECDPVQLYADLGSAGLPYGPTFACVRRAWSEGNVAWAQLELPESARTLAERFEIHPGLLDSCLHAAMLTGALRSGGGALLPFSWRGVRVLQPGSTYVEARVEVSGDNTVSVVLTDPAVGVIAVVDGLMLRELDPAALETATEDLYALAWPVADEIPAADAEIDYYEVATGSSPETIRSAAAAVLLQLQRRAPGDAPLVVVTRGAVCVDGEPAANLAGAAAWGLVRAFQMESEAPVRIVDVDVDSSDPEAAAGRIGLPQSAVRAGRVHVPRLVRMPEASARAIAGSVDTAHASVAEAAGPTAAADAPAAFRLGAGPVLVTGGTGGIGRVVAAHLAREYGVTKLLLVSRQGAAAPGAADVRDELVSLGAEAIIEACDLTVREQVEALVEAHRPSAIIHAAGVVDDALIADLDEARLAAVLGPKADAAVVLDEVTRTRPVDAFVCFSSASGLLGAPGQGNYAAANAVLDALVTRRRADGLAGVSIPWGLWRIGMSQNLTDADLGRLERSGVGALSGEEGCALLDAALASGHGIPVPIKLDTRKLIAGEVPDVLSGLAQPSAAKPARRAATAGAAAGLRAELAALDPDARHDFLLTVIRRQVSTVLGHNSALSEDLAFSELGFDSLSAVEFRNALTAATDIRLPATLAFDYPTPGDLARHLLTELSADLDDLAQPGPDASIGAVVARSLASGTGRGRPDVDDDPIVIVGMGCHYAGDVDSPADLWDLVVTGRDASSEFPTNRGWNLERVFDPARERPHTSYGNRGHFLHGAGDVDPDFFGISPNEAEIMDPQQFLLLETAWESLEHAGIDPQLLRGSATGVFAGLMYHDHVANNSTGAIFSGRVSYTLGLTGPSLTVDTACSSSLVALHLAGDSLRRGECDLALAGGVTVMGTPEVFVEFSRQSGLAADGRCKSYGEGADGTGWGEGVGVLVLERLSDARRKGHRVYGVIAGSAINQDGASNGLTAPNGPAQQRVIGAALADAGLSTADVDLVEGHGTGTRLGDPIEAQAVLATYGQGRAEGAPVHLGSIKSNIGHAQAAAGVAGIIKVVEAIRHGVLPKSLHNEEPSTHVDWTAGAVDLLGENREWPAGRVRRGAISSFGISGTNAHVIIEQAPADVAAPLSGVAAPLANAVESELPAEGATAAADAAKPPMTTTTAGFAGLVPIPLSGRAFGAVTEQALGLATRFTAGSSNGGPVGTGTGSVDTGSADLSCVAGVLAGRSAFGERAVVWAPDAATAAERLTALAAAPAVTQVTGAGMAAGRIPGTGAQLCYVFGGQGGQWRGMGAGLTEHAEVFAATRDDLLLQIPAAVDWLVTECGLIDLRGDATTLAGEVTQLLTEPPAPSTPGAEEEQIGTLVTQLGLYIHELALADQLAAWGVKPAVLIGHSIGEIAAAALAGVLTRTDALRLVVARGWLMGRCGGLGTMLAVQASEEVVTAALAATGVEARAGIGAVNSPTSIVVSGLRDAVDQVAAHCRDNGIRYVELRVADGFHSVAMAPALDGLRAVLGKLTLNAPTVPLVSTVTGRPDPGTPGEGMRDPEYWVTQVRGAVRFRDAVEAAAAAGATVFAEIGPDRVLAPLVAQILTDAVAVPLARRRGNEPELLLAGLAALWANGIGVKWRQLLGDTPWPAQDVPTYRFQRRRFWSDASEYAAAATWLQLPAGDSGSHGLEDIDHPILTGWLTDPGSGDLIALGRMSLADHPWLADHDVLGMVLYPGAGLVELAIAAGEIVGAATLVELALQAPLILGSDALAIQVVVGQPDARRERSVSIFSRRLGTAEAWTLHGDGVLGAMATEPDSLAAWPPPGASELPVEAAYDTLRDRGFAYGPVFQGLRRAWTSAGTVFGEIALPADAHGLADSFRIHPALLDAAMHPSLVAGAGGDQTTLPFVWRDVSVVAVGATTIRVRLTQPTEDSLSFDIAGESGRPVARVAAVVGRPVSAAQLASARMDDLWHVGWRSAGEVPVPSDAADKTPARHSSTAGPYAAGLADDVVLLPIVSDPQLPVPDRAVTVLTGTLARLQDLLARTDWSRCVVVTRGAVAAADGEPVAPEQAAVWGLVRAAEAENPGRFVLLDLPAGSPREPDPITVAAALAVGEAELAVRGGTAYVPRIVPSPAPEPLDAALLSTGTVLVTGGTTGIGAAIARHLVADLGVRDLVLVSRRGSAAPGAAELQAALAESGARIRIEACDVADRAQVHTLVAGLPELSAVVHCAGVSDNGLITDLTPERIDAVLTPKATSAWWLHEATQDRHLAAFVAISSAGGLTLAAGQGNYAAANVFVDGLMALRAAQGLPGTALAYGLWDMATGMTTDTDLAGERMASLGFPAIAPERGLALFDAAVTSSRPDLVGMTVDLAVLRSRGEALASVLLDLAGPAKKATVRAESDGGGALAEQLAGLDEDDALATVLDIVRRQVGAVLGHDDIDAVAADRAFDEMGFDSLAAVELRNQLGGVVGVRLPATLIFDYPNATAVARFVLDQIEPRAAAAPAPATASHPARPFGSLADDAIAIVGMGCRYPGGITSPAQLWRVVADGVDAIGPVPTDRGWDMSVFDPAGGEGKSYAVHGGFLDCAADFDPAFFGLGPREALVMDPQQRVLLQTTWDSLEHAGIDPNSLRGSRTGVWAGVMYHDYAFGADAAAASGGSLISGRVSYTLGLEGPSVSVDTACSSSLVALHQGSSALRLGECDLALVGGVAIMGTPGMMVEFSRQQGLSPDGRCRSYSESADGTGWSEGAGMLVLERLADARRNGHHVLGVIAGSAINQDGASNGFSAPNGPSQQRVIDAALAAAGLTTADIDLIEGHGTATRLGDPIEAQALLNTYGQGRRADAPAWLGSIKSNLGHTQAAAGVAGVIKVVEAIRHHVLPPSLHGEAPTAQVEWETGAVRLLDRARAWDSSGVRRGAVSSFGISGTNAHVIIEQAPEWGAPAGSDKSTGADPATSAGPAAGLGGLVPLVVSGRAPEAVAEQCSRLAGYLAETYLAETYLAETPGPGAEAAVGEGTGTGDYVTAPDTGAVTYDAPHTLATHTPALGASATADPGHRVTDALALTHVAAAMTRRANLPERLVVWGRDGDSLRAALTAAEQAQRHTLAQAARPAGDADQGQRISESTFLRGRAPSTGVTAPAWWFGDDHDRLRAIADGLREVEPFTSAWDEVVAETGDGVAPEAEPVLVQIALARMIERFGLKPRAVDGTGSGLVAAGVVAGVLDVATAAGLLAGVAPADVHAARPRVGIPEGADTTAFWSAIAAGDGPERDLPTPAAGPWLTIGARAGGTNSVVVGGDPAPGTEVTSRELVADATPEALVAGLAGWWVRGVDVDWREVVGRDVRPDLDAPTYPFQTEKYWVPPVRADHSDYAAAHPVLNTVLPQADGRTVVLAGTITANTPDWVADHEVGGERWYPGTGLVELALAAGRTVERTTLAELTIHAPLTVGDAGVSVQVVVSEPASATPAIAIHSRERGDRGPWTLHAEGRLNADPGATDIVATVPGQGAEVLAAGDLYAGLTERGFTYGPTFRAVTAAWRDGDGIVATLDLPANADTGTHEVHPVLLDAAMHALAFGGLGAADTPDVALVPFVWAGVRVGPAARATRGTVRLAPAAGMANAIRITVTDTSGALVASADQVVLRAATRGQRDLWRIGWRPTATPAPRSYADLLVVAPVLPDHVDPTRWVPALSQWSGEPCDLIIVPPVSFGGETGESGTAAMAATDWVLKQIGQLARDPQWQEQRAVVTTRSARAVAPGENVAVAHTGVIGLIRALQAEQPGRVVLADVTADHDLGIAAGLLGGDEPETAVRDGAVLVPRYLPVTGKTAAAETGDQATDPSEDTPQLGTGTCLITGGTGGLGRLIARHAATAWGYADIVLASRSGQKAAGATELTAELAELGANLRIVAGDVADRAAVHELVAGLDDLTAVVHCAGGSANGLVADLTGGDIPPAWQAKADGAWWLNEATRERKLAAYVLLSSAGGQVMAAGQGTYAAANTFLDGLAEARHSVGLPATAIAYGLWRAETGLSSLLREQDWERLERGGFPPLDADHALGLLDAAIADGAPVLAALAIDRVGLKTRADLPALVRDFASRAATPAAQPANIRATRIETPEDALDVVRATAAEVLGFADPSRIDIDLGVLELGFDSLSSVELRNRINQATGLDLPPTVAFDVDSLRGLAMLVHERIVAGAVPVTATSASAPASASIDRASSPAEPTLYDLFTDAIRQDRMADGMALLRTVAALRPAFTAAEPPAPAKALRYPTADNPVDLICLSTPTVAGGVHQQARLAPVTAADVVALPTPGFAKGEALPADLPAAVTAIADAVTASRTPDRPFALLGYSSGGLLAHAVAVELERRGITGLAGVVLVDTYEIAHPVNQSIFDMMGVAVEQRAAVLGEFSAVELSAMGRYAAILADFERDTLTAPVLFLTARDWFGAQPAPVAEWQPTWPGAQATAELPGSHFTLVEDDVATTAEVLNRWLRGLV